MSPGVAGPQADTPWSAGSTSWPPFGWSGHQCTTPGVAGRPVTFQWSRWSSRGPHHVTGGRPTLLPLWLLTIGECPLVLLVHRRASPGALGPRAGLPLGWSPPVNPWGGWSTSGPPMEWLVYQRTSPWNGGWSTSGPRPPWKGWSTSELPMEELLYQWTPIEPHPGLVEGPPVVDHSPWSGWYQRHQQQI